MTPSELRALRRQLKISLLELAARTGLPENYLSQIEEEKIKPLESDLKRIQKALSPEKKDQNIRYD